MPFQDENTLTYDEYSLKGTIIRILKNKCQSYTSTCIDKPLQHDKYINEFNIDKAFLQKSAFLTYFLLIFVKKV